MNEQVFRGPDADSAMEKALRALGDDAYILSVRAIEGGVEVRAAGGEMMLAPRPRAAAPAPLAPPPSPLSPPSPQPVRPAALNLLIDARLDAVAPAAPAVAAEDRSARNGEPPDRVPPAPQPAPRGGPAFLQADAALGIGASETAPEDEATDPEGGPAEPALTTEGPEAAAPAADFGGLLADALLRPDPAPVWPAGQGLAAPARAGRVAALRSLGFDEDFLETLEVPPGLPAEDLPRLALERLARELADPAAAEAVLARPALALVGPPGAGKSLLAARLGWERFRRGQGRSAFRSLMPPGLSAPTPLATHARLLGMPHAPGLDGGADGLPVIAEVAAETQAALGPALPALIGDLVPGATAVEADLLLVLPAPWRAAALQRWMEASGARNLFLALTQADLGEPDLPALLALHRAGHRLLFLASDTAISGALEIAEPARLLALPDVRRVGAAAAAVSRRPG